MKRQVLIVEDERSISSYVKNELVFEDYDVQTAFDGVEVLEKFENANPSIDVVLLDWMIPKIDGLGVLRRMKKIQPNPPIIFLTARDYVGDKIAGLDAGADDYITKPFEIEELLARLRLIFRKWSAERATIYRGEYLSLDTTAHVVTANGKPISLTQREYALLLFFMQHRGEAISRADVLDEVWGMNFDGQDNTVDAYVRYLRSKIDEPDTASLIETVRGVGYRMR